MLTFFATSLGRNILIGIGGAMFVGLAVQTVRIEGALCRNAVLGKLVRMLG